jgi:hypothetical protein
LEKCKPLSKQQEILKNFACHGGGGIIIIIIIIIIKTHLSCFNIVMLIVY